MEYCIFTEPQQGFTYDEQLRMAQAAERLGFAGWFRSDHYMKMGGYFDGTPGPTDAWTTLAALARETRSIRLGTLVSSATHRHPGILAIQVAQVDVMSNGRVELGLGTGWYEAEHRALGIPFPAKRFGLFEEQLAIVTGLLSTPSGESFDFNGEHYSLAGAPALPKPVQSPVPIIIGGGGPRRTPALAARFATEFNIGFRPEHEIAEKLAGVRQACERIDRDPASLKLSVALPTIVGADEAALARRAESIGEPIDQFRGDMAICGNADEVAAKVERLKDLGADRVYFQLVDMRDLEQLEYLGRDILPLLP